MADTAQDAGVEMTPEQQAFYLKATQSADSGVEMTPEQQEFYRKQTGQLDPLQDMSAEQLAHLEISDPEHFSVTREYLHRPDLVGKPDIISKAAEANRQVFARNETPGVVLDQIPGVLHPAVRVAEAGKQVAETAKNIHPIDATVAFAKGLGGYFRNLLIKKHPFTTAPDSEQDQAELQRGAAEDLAASESALTGLAGGVKTIAHKAAQGVGLAKRYSDYNQQETHDLFFSRLAKLAEQERIAKGHGPVTTDVGGHVIADLEAQGLPVRPEEVGKLAAGDPFSLYAFGKVFGAAGELAPSSDAVATATKFAGDKVLKPAAGLTLQTIGESAKKVAAGVKKVAPAAKPVGIVKGVLTGGPGGFLAGMKAGEIAKDVLISGAKKMATAADVVSNAGKELVTGEVATPLGQLATDVSESLPGAAADVAGGVGFDVGTAAAMAEVPEDERGTGIGTAFGLAGAGKRIGGRTLSGQLIGGRAWGSDVPVRSSGDFSALPKSPGEPPIIGAKSLDTLHAEAVKAAPPLVQRRVNAIRQFLQKAAPGVEFFYAPDSAQLKDTLLAHGVAPEDAQLWSQQLGLHLRSIQDKNGNAKEIAIARDVAAAPHEAFHPFQLVLGDEANNILNDQVRKSYTDEEFDALGKRYAARTGWDGAGDWRDYLNSVTGTGHTAALNKLTGEVAERMKANGATPTQAEIDAQVKQIWKEATDQAKAATPGIDPHTLDRNVWRGLLTDAEQKGAADNYAANEISAETWDAVFKHQGTSLRDPKGLIPKFARVAANVVSAFGGEPLAGRTSEAGQIPLRYEATQAVKKAVQGKLEIEPKAPSAPAKITPSPSAGQGAPQDRQKAAEAARTIAEQESDVPVAGGTKSPKENLGNLAEAIATGEGVKLNYLSAPDEPAAAIASNRDTRRSIIETFRNMPAAARSLWEKNFFPERIRKTGKGTQVGGWAPEVFAANAHKTAASMLRIDPALSPYELDPKTGSFSEQGWKDFYADVQSFVQNQMGGRTGSGKPLVVPQKLVEAGFYKPPQKGTPKAIDHRKADFISAMFGMKLPETPRMVEGRYPLNVAGQEVSTATQGGPTRLTVPVRPRGQYEKAPVEGRSILEVNPWRAELEEAARKKGEPLPSLIEAFQWLNLENIKETAATPEQPQFRGNTLTLQAGFQPQTEAGKKLEDRGFKFISRNFDYPHGGWQFSVQDAAGKEIANLQAAKEADGKTAEVRWVGVNSDFQRQGIGETLLRELGKRLQDAGITRLKSIATGEGAPEMLNKVFGNPIRGSVRRITSEVSPTARFQPLTHPRAIKSAAVKDRDGKIWEGTWHGDAYMKAQSAPGERGELLDGFTDNSGHFLDRADAAERALSLGQLKQTEKTPHLTNDEILESGELARNRAFQPRREIELVGPGGKAFKARFDGYQDATALGLGHIPQITALEDLPGTGMVKGSTTYGPALEKAGYDIPELPARKQPLKEIGKTGMLEAGIKQRLTMAKQAGKVKPGQQSELAGLVEPRNTKASFQPKKKGEPWVGVVTESGNVRGEQSSRGHSETGISDGGKKKWRATDKIYWWEHPTADERESVEHFLASKLGIQTKNDKEPWKVKQAWLDAGFAVAAGEIRPVHKIFGSPGKDRSYYDDWNRAHKTSE